MIISFASCIKVFTFGRHTYAGDLYDFYLTDTASNSSKLIGSLNSTQFGYVKAITAATPSSVIVATTKFILFIDPSSLSITSKYPMLNSSIAQYGPDWIVYDSNTVFIGAYAGNRGSLYSLDTSSSSYKLVCDLTAEDISLRPGVVAINPSSRQIVYHSEQQKPWRPGVNIFNVLNLEKGKIVLSKSSSNDILLAFNKQNSSELYTAWAPFELWVTRVNVQTGQYGGEIASIPFGYHIAPGSAAFDNGNLYVMGYKVGTTITAHVLYELNIETNKFKYYPIGDLNEPMFTAL